MSWMYPPARHPDAAEEEWREAVAAGTLSRVRTVDGIDLWLGWATAAEAAA